MMFLFGMECKKIAKSILYWVLILALLAVCLLQYDPAVESELLRVDDPHSVFFIAPNGEYAGDLNTVSDEDTEHSMMIGATNRLINNYRSNRYEYYPFGYIKEKTMSAQEQEVILQYLVELTGLSEQAIKGAGDATDDNYIGDVPISGDGAFVLEPGKGSTNESGQFVIEPEDWQYVENGTVPSETPQNSDSSISENRKDGQTQEQENATEDGHLEAKLDEDQANEDGGTPSESIESPIENTAGTPIFGDGPFVLEPGHGSTNESGQFVITPEDWQYVENGATPSGTSANTGRVTVSKGTSTLMLVQGATKLNSRSTMNRGDLPGTPQNSVGGFEVQVPFDRFKEIMEEVNRMIGRNSYFSWTMLTLYYVGNDMQDNPITAQQHHEFYEGDQVTGAFARYYCDSISLVVLFLPAFVIVDLMLRDKRRKMQGLTYPRTISSAKVICTRYAASVCMTMLPILILPVKSLFVLMRYCGSIGVQADVLAFAKYTLTWILPTVLLVVAISLLVTVLFENYIAIFLTGLIWLVGRPSVDKIAGGNYDLFDLIIRHNTLKGYGRMMENIQMLILNRVIISAIALVLVGLTIVIYSMKRKGGLILWGQKSSFNHSFKHSSEF